jgi:hypothetical protein
VTSPYLPDVTVEIAFNAGYLTPAADRVWTDVSAYVEAEDSITITRGRSDELSEVQPSQLSVTFDNRDGRFTPGNTAGAYYPNVKIGRPIRVRATWDGVTYDRFLGFISDWPIVWPHATDSACLTTVSAASRMARIAGGANLRSVVEDEYLADDPTAYYPMGEPEGSNSASSIAGGVQPRLASTGTGDPVAFGAGTGPATDAMPAPMFAGGQYLQAPLNITTDAVTVVEIFFNTSATWVRLVSLHSVNSGSFLRLATNGADLIAEVHDGTNGSTIPAVGSALDGRTHHAAVVLESATRTLRVFLDGVEAPSSTVPGVGPLNFTSTHLTVGEQATATLAHVAVWTTPTLDAGRIAAHAEAGLTGFAEELPGVRIERIAERAGIPPAEVNADAGVVTMAFTDTTGRSPLDVMREVETTEAGLLFDGRDGALRFHSRSRRYNADLAFALDATAQEVEADLEPVLDDQMLTNDVTATDGTNTVRAADDASILEYGQRRQDLQLAPADPDALTDIAYWRLNRYREPKISLRQISASVPNASGSAYGDGVYGEGLYGGTAGPGDLLAADIGDRFTLVGLPTQSPAPSMDLFIEGTSETITATSHTIGFTVSGAAVSDVWVLDSAEHSELDSTTVLAL